MPQLTTFRLYLLGIALLFGAYILLEYNRPKPLDWTPSYANKDKIPYGTFALYDQLPRLLGTDSVEVVRLPAYSQLTGSTLSDEATTTTVFEGEYDDEAEQDPAEIVLIDSTASDESDPTSRTAEGGTAADSSAWAATPAQADTDASEVADTEDEESENESSENEALLRMPLRAEQANYLFINKTFEPSGADIQALLEFVARGNDVFVAAERFGSSLLRDSLGLRLQEADLATHKGAKGLPVIDSVDIRFTNPALASRRFRLPGTSAGQRIVVEEGRTGSTLATDAKGQAVLVRLDHGRGHFYFCSTPVAFTNYFLLRPRTTAFAASALAYLPARLTWWDEYQKQGPIGEQSLLRVVFAHEALRWAYYLLLGGSLLFVAVAARRRQRVIPTLNPLPNTTLLFTRTVAGLYRQGKSHGLIAEKKVTLFADYLRTRFQETSPDFGDPEFRERLSQKSGVPRPRVDELLRLVNFARTAPRVTDQQLLQLSRALSDFKRESR
ncbi:hypothetical protein BEN47_08980 [Hymenobacter lapidarius]|uniref:DUF4350 domain-containing protein n=1 Tax=Hymenobacter lapidarius TaxID=1908237 RepID=A0A1G1TC65_9BACT|nr:DUF4350 domain-containing protein [Hymenobacter lapidarius]OGX88462.1 hypothetical protein BEN47_08980 [Hymenobacter lapidarius]